MKLEYFKIVDRFKNLENIELDFSGKNGTTVLIGNNGSGKSNMLEAISNIFACLYNHSFSPPLRFKFELRYSKDTHKIEIKYDNSNYDIIVNGNADILKPEYLPTQIISCYSGEESRLWEEYYKPFYENYIKALRGDSLPSSELIYINKYYWNIALLTFYYHDFSSFTDLKDFCENTLGIQSLDKIKFSFDISKLRSWPSNPVTNFVKAINPTAENLIEIDLTTLKSRVSSIANEIDFFRYLSAAFMPKDDKLITKIELTINNNITANCLSEGEKKLMLIKLILEVIGDENSLILLDEPDSHVHVSKKKEIVKMLSQYSNRENVITTHSPTLAHHFDNKHITMLSRLPSGDAKIESKEKQEVVHDITNGIWSYMEQNIFLNSSKDILLVEGKTDEIILKKALSSLQLTMPTIYNGMDFEYIPCGGASNVKLFVDKFNPKSHQRIIALFDNDNAGWEGITAVFDDGNKYRRTNPHPPQKNDTFILVYPYRRYFRGGSDFNIEDYFPKYILNRYVLKNFKSLSTLSSKDTVKKLIAKECHSFDDSSFLYFSVLFEKIASLR